MTNPHRAAPSLPAETGHIQSGFYRLIQNGELRQDSDLADMISSVPAIIANLSGFVELAPGDLIYTGTPSGVGPTAPGDVFETENESLSKLSVTINGATF